MAQNVILRSSFLVRAFIVSQGSFHAEVLLEGISSRFYGIFCKVTGSNVSLETFVCRKNVEKNRHS